MRKEVKKENKLNLINLLLKVLFNQILDIHLEEVSVVVEFVECFTHFKDALKRYDSHNHIEKRFESAEGEYIYSVHYAVTDASLEGELFNIYLYTYDKRGLEFLSGLNPDKIFGRNILSYQ